LLILLVLGSIYLGIATPTEAASLAAVIAVILGLVYRKFSWQILKESALSTAQTTSMLIFIMVGALLIGHVLAMLQVPRQLVGFITSLSFSKIWILVGIYMLYFVLGMFLMGMPLILLTLPVVQPVMVALGYDTVWLGIILVKLCETAMESPPIGLNLYIIQGIAPHVSFGDIVIGTFPYLVIDFALVFVFTIFPSIILWLPSHMIGSS
jgi:C4-dicarboxylate transporter DctM subunit